MGVWRQLAQPYPDLWLSWEARDREGGGIPSGAAQNGEAERLAFVRALVSQASPQVSSGF